MKRHRYNGMVQIVVFNWHQYVAGATACTVAGWAWWRLPLPPIVRVVLGLGAGVAAFWLVASLAVSHYVYDRSGLSAWDWARPLFSTPPARWANIHCGFDETTRPLMRVFPNTEYGIWDISDEDEMTEASIRRARRYPTQAPTAVRARFDTLPAKDREMEAVFVLFVAHEIRNRRSRRAFFGELRRVLAPGGQLLLVEHLRDGWNCLAFGPGCGHFLPRREWMRCAREAGFAVEREVRKTVFVRAWLLRKER